MNFYQNSPHWLSNCGQYSIKPLCAFWCCAFVGVHENRRKGRPNISCDCTWEDVCVCTVVSCGILNVQNCLLHSMLSVTHYATRSVPPNTAIPCTCCKPAGTNTVRNVQMYDTVTLRVYWVGLATKRTVFDSLQMQHFSVHDRHVRPPLGPGQSPVQW